MPNQAPVVIQWDVKQAQAVLSKKRRAFKRAMTDAGNEIAGKMLTSYKSTTATWSHKPEFEKVVQVAPTTVTVLVGTDDKVWNMLDKGSPPHPIAAKRAKFLVFRVGGFQSKTQPNLLTARQGSAASGPLMFVKFLKNGHPGHKARNWTRNIYKTMPARGRASLEKHMARAAAA